MFNAIIIHVAANWQLRPYVDIPHMCSGPLGSRKRITLNGCQYSLPQTTLCLKYEILRIMGMQKQVFSDKFI